MKKIIPIITIVLLAMVSCRRSKSVSEENKSVPVDSVETNDNLKEQKDIINSNKKESVIEFMCKDAESMELTPEEIAYLDSMNAQGVGMIVRGAERNLDTIVNHTHYIFVTDLK